MKTIRIILHKLVFLLLFCAILSGCSASSPVYSYTEFNTMDSKSYAISQCTNTAGFTSVEIPTEFQGAPVQYILDEAFENLIHIESLQMKTIIDIYPEAFKGCRRLKRIDFGCVETISSWAFDGCDSLEVVYLPETLKRIESGAFSRCKNLIEVHFMGNPEYLEAPFDEGMEITIYGSAGSIVEEYAIQNGFNFVESKE